MKTKYLIQILFLMGYMLCQSSVAIAQDYKNHKIERGENLESIAKKYNTTKEEIIKLNPNVAQFIFVGMNLKIPVVAVGIQSMTDKSVQNATPDDKQEITGQLYSHASFNENPFRIKLIGGMTYGQWYGKDFSNVMPEEAGTTDPGQCKITTKGNFGVHVGIVGDYFFNPNLYAGLGLIYNMKGFKQNVFMDSGQYWNDEGANFDSSLTNNMRVHNMDIPVHLGYQFEINSDISLFAEAGGYLSYALSGTKSTKGYYTEFEDIHSSGTEYIDEKINIGKDGLKDYQKFGYGLSASIGINYDRYSFQFTYQHGLSKLMKNSKQYEKNIMFSLGYRIF